MALIHCHFYSESIGMSTSMTVILPQQTQTQIGMESNRGGRKLLPTLYLLHGLSDDDTIWTRRTSIERYVASMGIAVVMPNVHKSFYANMEYGENYWTFLTEELPAVARSFFPLSDKREDNFVAGLSMGGYGAMKWALSYPDRIAAAASLSGSLDIVERVKNGPSWLKFDFVFGNRQVEGTGDDLLWLLKQAGESEGTKPKLYQCCGTEDFLYQDNLTFRDACRRAGFDLTYEEETGDHNWAYWDMKIQNVLNWLPISK